MLIDGNNLNNFPQEAKDFFFGANSPLHKFTNIYQIHDEIIEMNLGVIQSGMAKAITYHGAMESHKGINFLSSRFPTVNHLITQLYFTPHGKSSPHLTGNNTPSVLVEALNHTMNQFSISASAFEAKYIKYISPERLGKYNAINPAFAIGTTTEAGLSLENDRSFQEIVGKNFHDGVGDSDVQAVDLAFILKCKGINPIIRRIVLDHRKTAQYVVDVTMPDGKQFVLDPWRGIIIPHNLYHEYYAGFKEDHHSNNLNNIFPDASFFANIVIVSQLPKDSVVKEALRINDLSLYSVFYERKAPSLLYRGSAFPIMQPPSDKNLLDQRMAEAIKHSADAIGSKGIIQSFTTNRKVAEDMRQLNGGEIHTIHPKSGDTVMSIRKILVLHGDRLVREKKVTAEDIKNVASYLDLGEDEYFWLLSGA